LGKIIATTDGGYATTASTLFGSNGVFLKVNRDLEIEFYHEFVDSLNNGELYIAPIEISNGFLLYGILSRPNTKFDAFIRRVDSQGNTVWWKTYGEYNRFEFFKSAALVSDSVFAFAGATYNNQGNFANPWICVIDVNGEIVQEWKAPVGYTAFDDMRFAFPTSDHGWLTYSVADLGLPPIYNGWVRNQSTWVKLDSNFQVQWTKRHGPSIYYVDHFHDFVRAPNGDIIGVGERGPYHPPTEGYYRKGWVMRFTPEGDSLWQWAGTLDPEINTLHYLSGVGLLSSGSIVAAGQSIDAEGDWSCWVVKMSGDGCVDTIFCHPVAAPEAPTEERDRVQVFPNPADRSVRIGLASGEPMDSVLIIDWQGQKLISITQPGRTYDLNLGNLAPGIYLVNIETKTGSLGQTKLVVAR
jgi:hypothetical protein